MKMQLTGVAALVALLMAAGCGQLAACGSGNLKMMQERKYMVKEAALSATFQVLADGLKYEYSLANTSQSDLYVIDVVVNVTAAGASVEKGQPRIELTPAQEVLLLSSLIPTDPSINYAAPPIAYASLLKAGATRHNFGTLSFPLIPKNLSPSPEVQIKSCDRVVLVVGIVPVKPQIAAIEQEIEGVKIWRLPFDAWRHQKELRFEASVPNISVLINK